MAEAKAPLDHRIAGALLDIGAVSLSPEAPYTWASGMKSPVYCDNRLTLSYPEVRRAIAEGFVAILERYDLAPDVIVGTATAGIPHAAWLAEKLHLPMAYVRSKAKAHGQGRKIEGRLTDGQRVVLVEDLISTGMSSLAAVDALQEQGAEVAAVLAIFTYGLPDAADAFAARDLPLYTLTDFEALLAVARQRGDLTPKALASLSAWRRDPHAWPQVGV